MTEYIKEVNYTPLEKVTNFKLPNSGELTIRTRQFSEYIYFISKEHKEMSLGTLLQEAENSNGI